MQDLESQLVKALTCRVEGSEMIAAADIARVCGFTERHVINRTNAARCRLANDSGGCGDGMQGPWRDGSLVEPNTIRVRQGLTHPTPTV